jgi:hypothetical protein
VLRLWIFWFSHSHLNQLSGHVFSCGLWSKQVATLLQKFFFSFSGWWILWLAVSFGYSSVDDYYYDSSSAHSIKDVKIPLLCIQAENDPIAPARGIPRADIEVDSMFTILLYFFLCCNVFPRL